MELTERSEMAAHKVQMSGNYPKERIQTITKFKCQEHNVGLCASPCFQLIIPNYIAEDQLTLNWKRGAHKCK